MTINFFSEFVAIKKIKYEGGTVRFFIDEEFAGFLFKEHKINELIVPTKNVDAKLLELLRKAPNYELDNVEMVLEGRATSNSVLK
jgi:Fe2+ or Zn2+ uptake regulation protein